MLVFRQIRVGLELVVRVSTILGNCYRASTRLRYQRLEVRHEDEPLVRTLIRQNLQYTIQRPDPKMAGICISTVLG